MILTPLEVAHVVLADPGWKTEPVETQVTVVAIGLGEADKIENGVYGVNPQAHNRNAQSGDDSYGWLQINYVPKYRAERIRLYGPPEGQFDPAHCAKTGYDLYVRRGKRFTDWGAFRDGGYRKYGRYDIAEDAVFAARGQQPKETPVALRYDPPTGRYTTLIPAGTQAFRRHIAEKFGIKRTEVVRDRSRCKAKGSEHCECRAIDFFTRDRVLGRRVFDYCVANAARFGIQSVIFLNREWGFGDWKERYREKDDHFDHVHVGLNFRGAAQFNQEEDDLTPEQAKKLDAVYDAIFTNEAQPRNRLTELDKRIKEGVAKILAELQR